MDPSGFSNPDGSFYVIFGRILSKKLASKLFFSYIAFEKAVSYQCGTKKISDF